MGILQGLSLRVKIMGILVALTLVLGLGGTLHARATLTRISNEQMEKRAVTLARDLAVQHADLILTNDIFALYGLINDFLISNNDLRYVFILDPAGSVRITSFATGLPKGLREVNPIDLRQEYSVVRFQSEEGIIFDVGMPVLQGQAGVVRVGLLEKRLEEAVNRQTFQLLGLTAAVTLVGLVIAYFLGTLLTRPLFHLVGITQAVARGDLAQKALVGSRDEVGQLGAAFNAMTEALARSHAELLRRNAELSALNAIAVAVGRSLELEEVLDAALAQVLELMQLPAGWIFLREDGTDRLSLGAWRGVSPDLFSPDQEVTMGACICQKILRNGEARLVENIEDCPRLRRWATREQDVCHVSVPLRSGKRVLGLMNLVCPRVFARQKLSAQDIYLGRAHAPRQGEDYPRSEEALRLLTAIGHQIGVAVENARLYHELQHKEALRGQLLQKLISAQEEERRRIARELHDQYAQALTALSVGLEAAERVLPAEMTAVRTQLTEVRHLAAQTLDQTYDLIFDLRPTTLDDLGLVPAIRWYAESRLERLGVQVHLEASGLRERLPAEMETALYRVIQEALLNIAKHARAHQVHIHLAVQDGRLYGLVEDDGQGFNPAEVQRTGTGGRGMGLLGMQERVELLGGTLHVETAPGQGTRVIMELPLSSVPPAEAGKAGIDVANHSRAGSG